MTITKQPLAQLILSAVIFGLGAVFVVFIDLSAVMITFYRLFIGAAVFAGVLFVSRQSFYLAKTPLLYACLAGIFFAADLSLWNASILTIGPGIATILNSLQIFFMAGFALFFYREKVDSRLIISLIITFLGVVLLSSHEIHVNTAGAFGVGAGVASAATFAVSMLCLRIAVRHASDSLVAVMFYASVAGALASGLWGVANDDRLMTDTLNNFIVMVAYAIFVHVIAWFLMAKSMPHVDVAVVGLIFCLEPVLALVVDVTALAKPITALQLIGAVITLAAIYFGSQLTKK